MKVNHFTIYRWGAANIWFDGTKEEIDYFVKWVEKYVPKKYFYWHQRVGRSGEEFHDTHLCGAFDCCAWTFLCTYWTNTDAPTLNQTWKERPNPHYPGVYEFSGKQTLLEHDNGILNLAMAYLQKEARDDGQKTPELKETIDFLQKQWRKLYNKLPSTKKLDKAAKQLGMKTTKKRSKKK